MQLGRRRQGKLTGVSFRNVLENRDFEVGKREDRIIMRCKLEK
jgi:hypothetical protein